MSIPAKKKPMASHPGKLLMWGFLDELDISQKQLSEAIGVKPQYINDIVQGIERDLSDYGYQARACLGLSISDVA